MNTGDDRSEQIRQAILTAAADRTPLQICGGGSKLFYGRLPQGKRLDVTDHRGIVNYQVSELVITARCGTPLAEIEDVLKQHGQRLAFDPPHFADSATLGGAIACGLSGSGRPYSGSARDVVLGCRILDGRGDILNFGGEVMKNVAGYDISRLMVGAMGTLGVLLQISLKVLPIPQQEMTCTFALGREAAMQKMQQLALQPLPLSALSYDGETAFVRFSGAAKAVQAAARKCGGDMLPDAGLYWRDLKEQRLDFFNSDKPLWRVSVPPAAADLQLDGEWFWDWAGALRWLKSDEPADKVFAVAAEMNGHATLFRSADRNGEIFQPLVGKLRQLQYNLKKAFDPSEIFNPWRMYRDW